MAETMFAVKIVVLGFDTWFFRPDSTLEAGPIMGPPFLGEQ